MPNSNYRAGRAFEYKRRKDWIRKGYEVVRSAGSHGVWDLCAVSIHHPEWPVLLIQLKRVEKESQGKLLLKRFKESPPLTPSSHYHLVMEVQVKGSKEVMSVEV